MDETELLGAQAMRQTPPGASCHDQGSVLPHEEGWTECMTERTADGPAGSLRAPCAGDGPGFLREQVQELRAVRFLPDDETEERGNFKLSIVLLSRLKPYDRPQPQA